VKKTSIYLEDELDRALALRAAEEGITKAELIRRSLKGVVGRPSRQKPSVGVFRSGLGDLSVRDEDYLTETGFGS
jgi:TATA-box binding protein (TBP) (component of TFIID and TFIIIB)